MMTRVRICKHGSSKRVSNATIQELTRSGTCLRGDVVKFVEVFIGDVFHDRVVLLAMSHALAGIHLDRKIKVNKMKPKITIK